MAFIDRAWAPEPIRIYCGDILAEAVPVVGGYVCSRCGRVIRVST